MNRDQCVKEWICIKITTILLVVFTIFGCSNYKPANYSPIEILVPDNAKDCGYYSNYVRSERKLRKIEKCISNSRIKGIPFVLRESHSGMCAGEFSSEIYIEKNLDTVLMYQSSMDEAGFESTFVGKCDGLKFTPAEGINVTGCRFSKELWDSVYGKQNL